MPLIVQAEQLEKWCKKDNPDDVRFTNVATNDLDGYERCGDVSTVALCDPIGKRYFGPAKGAPSSNYQDCSQGPRIYIEKDGIPINVGEAMRAGEQAQQAGYVSRSKKKQYDEVPTVSTSLDSYYKLMDGLLEKDGKGAKKGSPFARTSGKKHNAQPTDLKDLDQMIAPLLQGPLGGMLQKLTGGEPSGAKNLTEDLQKRLKSYDLGEDFFAD